MSRREAIEEAWRWLRALRIAEKARRWKAVPAPEQTGSGWYVHWQAGGWAAAVKIDARSGDLLSADSWPAPPVPSTGPK
jgi:hypothetical protein